MAREHIAPTDIVCIVFVVVLAILYGITRDADFKVALLGLILFQSGRLSKTMGEKLKINGS